MKPETRFPIFSPDGVISRDGLRSIVESESPCQLWPTVRISLCLEKLPTHAGIKCKTRRQFAAAAARHLRIAFCSQPSRSKHENSSNASRPAERETEGLEFLPTRPRFRYGDNPEFTCPLRAPLHVRKRLGKWEKRVL